MPITIKASALRETKWHEYAVRFVFGGLVTAGAGLVSKHFGAAIGGLFLAFPSVFPATLTLIAKHERQQKARRGVSGTERGKLAAGVEAAGTAISSTGLLLFAMLVWFGAPRYSAPLVLIAATLAWMSASFFLWWVRKHHVRWRKLSRKLAGSIARREVPRSRAAR